MPAANDGRTAKPHFRPQDNVEVTSSEPGFIGVWFEAKVLGRERRGAVKVKYKHIVHDDDHSRFLEEFFEISNVRPARGKPAEPEELRPGDAVEAFVNDGWWVGHITTSAGDGSHHVVSFPDSDQQIVHTLNLRRRLDWVHGSWIAPLSRSVMDEKAPNYSPATTTKAAESIFPTLRKRERPFGSSGKSKEKVTSPMIGNKKIKGNAESSNSLSIHKFQSGCSAADDKKKIVSCCTKPSLDVEKGTPFPTGNKDVLKKSKSMSSIGSFDELASLDSVAVIEISSQSSQELAVPAPSRPNFRNNKGDQHNPKLLTHPVMNHSFVKKTSVWNALLSLEIFRVMPQLHFRPLEQLPENEREGTAIGLMVSYANMADDLQTLNIDDDDDTIDGLVKRLDSLEVYEQHGFAVEVFKNKLKDLIGLKRTLENFSQEKVQLEAALAQTSRELSKSASEVDEIDQKAKELEGSLHILQNRRIEALDTKNKLESKEFQLRLKIQLINDKSYHVLKNDVRI